MLYRGDELWNSEMGKMSPDYSIGYKYCIFNFQIVGGDINRLTEEDIPRIRRALAQQGLYVNLDLCDWSESPSSMFLQQEICDLLTTLHKTFPLVAGRIQILRDKNPIIFCLNLINETTSADVSMLLSQFIKIVQYWIHTRKKSRLSKFLRGLFEYDLLLLFNKSIPDDIFVQLEEKLLLMSPPRLKIVPLVLDWKNRKFCRGWRKMRINSPINLEELLLYISNEEKQEQLFNKEVLINPKTIVVVEHSLYSEISNQIKPILIKIANYFSGIVHLIYVNALHVTWLVQKYNLDSFPCLMFFKDGKFVLTEYNLHSNPDLHAEFIKNLF